MQHALVPQARAHGSPGHPLARFTAGSAADATLLVFSHLRYDYVFQRPQQVMSRLARQCRILFVEEPVRTDGPARLLVWQPTVNVQVLQPHTPLAAPGFHDDQVPLLRELLQSAFDAVDRPIAWLYTPMALPLIADIDTRAIVYDCMDELGAIRSAPRQLPQREAGLLRRADAVFTGGRSLYRAKRARHPNVFCFPGAVDAGCFARRPEWQDPWPQVGHPRLGYFGVIDERVDLTLLGRLARERPQWQIFMVGPHARIDVAALPRRSNIHWLGQQAFESLPRLAAYWDVCLMPFALNEATRFISPTKTLEYMAAGKPIVSTHVRDVADCYADVVRIANTPSEFVAACDAALGETAEARAASRQTMLDLAADLTWDATVAGMAAAAFGTRTATVDARFENVVIGAGATGLAAALSLSRDTLLVEREKRSGGMYRAITRDGYLFERDGHLMSSTEPYVLALVERLLGPNVHWQRAENWNCSDGDSARCALESGLARFGYPLRGGFQALLDGFLPLLPGELRTGVEVIAVDGPGRRVTLSTGETVSYENLVVTASLPQLVRMLGEHAPAGVQAAARALRSMSVRCVNIGVRRTDVTDKHWIAFPDATIFHRIFAQGNASPSCSPAGSFGFTCEIKYGPAQPLPCTGLELIDRVVADCRRVGFLRADDTIELAFDVDIPLAYVVDDQQRARNVARIRHWLTTLDIHLAGRFAEWQCHDAADHAFVAGRRIAQKLTHRLVDPPTAKALSAR